MADRRKPHDPIMTYERAAIRRAFMTDEPVRQIAHRFGIDTGSVYYHCRDLRPLRPPRPRGRNPAYG